MTEQNLLNRALGAYLGFACGDALGATVEFMSAKQIQRRYGAHTEMIGGGWLGLPPGAVTDDTQMALALGQALIVNQGFDLTAVANAFLAWLDSGPPDVGDTCRRGLKRYRETGALHGEASEQDAGNGALMRNLPVLLATLHAPEHMRSWSLAQSRITHHNALSDAATLAIGNMTQRLLIGEDRDACRCEIEALITEFPQFRFEPYPGKASAYVVDTVQTVLHYFFTTDNFEACLIATVNQGGDADTTGALAGMLAGARYGVAQIPERWLSRLDQADVQQINRQVTELVRLSRNRQ